MSDAEFKIIPPADPPQAECLFKIGDIIQHHMDIEDQAGTKWQIVGITSERLSVVNFNDHNDASHIEQRFWRNYSRVGTASAKAKEQLGCPFKVGDMVELKAKPGEHWRVVFVDSAGFDLTSLTNSQSKRFIWRYGYDKYQLVAAVGNDAIECPFKLGDVIQFHDAAVSKTQWQIDRILSDRLHVSSHDPYQTPSQIDRQFWGNYRIVIPTTLDAIQQTC